MRFKNAHGKGRLHLLERLLRNSISLYNPKRRVVPIPATAVLFERLSEQVTLSTLRFERLGCSGGFCVDPRTARDTLLSADDGSWGFPGALFLAAPGAI
jgi:hypothetical protein